MAKQIGELLKQEGVIDEKRIKYALLVQKTVKKRLGELLIDLGFVTEKKVSEILARQAGLIFLDVEQISPDKDALSVIPYNFALQNDVLPVVIENKKLVVAIADPFNQRTRSMLERFSRYPISYAVSQGSMLSKKIERFYYIFEHPIAEQIDAMRKSLIAGQTVSVENLINIIIEDAIDNNASDIHISAASESTLILYRIDGVLHLFYSLPLSIHTRIVSTVKIRSSMDIATTNAPQDGNMTFEFLHEKYDLRVSTVPTLYGENLVLRILGGHGTQLMLDQIGFDNQQIELVRKAVGMPFGIIIAVGPTGAGKTTTLYSLIREVDATEKNVMTIEDPIEFKMPLVRQVAYNKKAGLTFASAIRSFLRQDPDVMMVGEIRDSETAMLATRAALTGHLVFSTLHANDAIGAISRLSDLGIGNFLLSSSLSVLIAQRLLRRLCPYCKKEITPEERIKSLLEIKSDTVFAGQGCEKCRGGYTGRVAAAEIILVTKEIKEMIAEGKSPVEIEKYVKKNGVKNMKEKAVEFVENGVTDIAEVERVFGF